MALKFGKKKKKSEADTNVDEAEDAAKKEANEGQEKSGNEGDEAADSALEEGGEKKKKKKILLIAIVALVVLAGGGAALLLGGDKKEHTEMGDKSPEEMEHNLEGIADGVPVYFELPQLLVNLNTGGKTTSFIKAGITLQLYSATDVPSVQANLPRLIDNYNAYLREMKTSDLYGSAGMFRLREEMLKRAQLVLDPVKVRDVLFREMLVQ